MKVGDHCFLEKASAETSIFYQRIKNTGLPLICPCGLKNTDELVITDKLTSKFFLLKLVRNNQLTVAHFADLALKS